MTLQSSASISDPLYMSEVETELGLSGTIYLDQSQVRTLFGVPSGTIYLLDGLGKSNVTSRPRPTTSSFTGTASYSSSSNDTLAYDVVAGYEQTLNTTGTPASLAAAPRTKTSPGLSNATMIYSGFSGSATSGTLKIYLDGTTADSISPDSSNEAISDVDIYYSTTGVNGTYTPLDGISGGGIWSGYTASVVLSGITLSNLAVKVVCSGQSYGTTNSNYAAAGATASIYDIILTT
jgi:hypothetical protein